MLSLITNPVFSYPFVFLHNFHRQRCQRRYKSPSWPSKTLSRLSVSSVNSSWPISRQLKLLPWAPPMQLAPWLTSLQKNKERHAAPRSSLLPRSGKLQANLFAASATRAEFVKHSCSEHSLVQILYLHQQALTQTTMSTLPVRNQCLSFWKIVRIWPFLAKYPMKKWSSWIWPLLPKYVVLLAQIRFNNNYKLSEMK